MTANLVLSWMLFGRSYETMVTLLESYASDEKNGRIIRIICAKAIKYIISSSIKSGYRTREQWNEYQSECQILKDGDATGWVMKDIAKTTETVQASQEGPEALSNASINCTQPEENLDQETPPLLTDFLFCENKDRVLQVIHDYFLVMSLAKNMAYVNITLLQMGILREYHDEKTFYQALVNQYPDITFKALRSYRDARQKLMDAAGIRYIYEIGSDAAEIAYVRKSHNARKTKLNGQKTSSLNCSRIALFATADSAICFISATCKIAIPLHRPIRHSAERTVLLFGAVGRSHPGYK
jgi:hypothetical protein